MKTIDALIEEKRQQVAKLQAQLEVLEELSAESGGPRARSAPRSGRRRSQGGRGRGRAGRGANQQRVLAVLGDSPKRARDIAAEVRLTPAAVSQVLMVLTKRGLVRRAGRGLYGIAGKGSGAPTAQQSQRPRGRKGKKKGTARKARGRKSRASKESSSREEASSSASTQA